MVETLGFRRGNLPHWLVADHTYFVTIRIHGTLPAHVVRAMTEERRVLLGTRQLTEDHWLDLSRRQFLAVERILGACDNRRRWLAEPAVASLVMASLAWMETRGWSVLAATVMSNHLHLLIRNTEGRSGELLRDLGQFKGFTGREANRLLGRTGSFWAREDFDHWCRNDAKIVGAARYICQNPVEARLVSNWRDWPWTRCTKELAPA